MSWVDYLPFVDMAVFIRPQGRADKSVIVDDTINSDYLWIHLNWWLCIFEVTKVQIVEQYVHTLF